MSVRVQLFGSPRVLREGQPLVFDTRKAVALLAHLAVTGTRHRRESLAGLLWPEADPTRARATLRRTLSVAAAVGPVLRMEGTEVWLEGASCDVIAFEHALAAGGVTDLQQAVELATEPFLAGFALRDSPEFDEWQAMTADRLRDGLAGALGALTVAMAGRGDVGAALGHARARLALDPLSEPAHRDLMRALALAGDRPGALRQYRSLIRLLDRELGVPPLPETADLAAAIRRGEAPPWPGPTVGTPDANARPATASIDATGTRGDGGGAAGTTLVRGSGPVLLDRDDALGELMGAWRSAARTASVIGVSGEAGIGRTGPALRTRQTCRPRGRGLVLGVRDGSPSATSPWPPWQTSWHPRSGRGRPRCARGPGRAQGAGSAGHPGTRRPAAATGSDRVPAGGHRFGRTDA